MRCTNMNLYSYTSSHVLTQYMCTIYLNQCVDLVKNLMTGENGFDSLQGRENSSFLSKLSITKIV